jgi:hypothetical protein
MINSLADRMRKEVVARRAVVISYGLEQVRLSAYLRRLPNDYGIHVTFRQHANDSGSIVISDRQSRAITVEAV